VSVRAGDGLLITPAAALADVRPADLVAVALDASELPPAAPREAWLHLRVYARRPDVTAIARAQPPAAFAVAAVTTALRPFYGQACWLGASVPVHDDARLLRSPDLADAAAATLGDADAMLLRGNGAVAVGKRPGLAATRMVLLAAACEAWLAASACGPVRPLTGAEVDSWRSVHSELLPRLWRHLEATHD
jgi:ribulose-5-phosphate 4-epimerase/fuculose-1-phosphate aldolase